MKKMNKAIQFASSIDSVRPLKDGTMSLIFHTQELGDEEKLVILNLLGKFGWLLFKEDSKGFDDSDVPREDSGYGENKSPSQRLRAVIYVYWEQNKKEAFPDFEVYYRRQMEALIGQYKEKLS